MYYVQVVGQVLVSVALAINSLMTQLGSKGTQERSQLGQWKVLTGLYLIHKHAQRFFFLFCPQ